MGSAGDPPLVLLRDVADPLNTSPSHMCYHVRFRRSATKGIRIKRREPHKFGSAGAPPPCGVDADSP